MPARSARRRSIYVSDIVGERDRVSCVGVTGIRVYFSVVVIRPHVGKIVVTSIIINLKGAARISTAVRR